MELLLGFVIALTIGLTGVGGGVLTVPLLVLYLDVPAAAAVGTALAFSAVVKVPACLVYLRQGRVDGRVLRLMLWGGLPGVVTGSVVLLHLTPLSAAQVVGTDLLFGLALSAVGDLLHRGDLRLESSAVPQAGRRRPAGRPARGAPGHPWFRAAP